MSYFIAYNPDPAGVIMFSNFLSNTLSKVRTSV
uniref:Uncharacterized protein n=1 Tax=Podoviridae sp. ct8Lf7 TaxID=2827723 RepID=A0A8S5S107_9CAUD|nr:MAG TPA: hypothetical protein [Podoviridae sp. ct8Lf7]